MLSEQNYIKILSYFDKRLWDGKISNTNWKYYGLVLDWYFDNSVLSAEYLDIADFFDQNGGLRIVEDQYLVEQYSGLPNNKWLHVLQNILNILKLSSINKEQSNNVIEIITKVLLRDNVKVRNPEAGDIILVPDDILDYGSYCNIVRVREGVLRKELKPPFQNDEKLQKRMRYEFENMQKLEGCPQILNVYEYDPDSHSYLMEQGDINLYNHLEEEFGLAFEDKLKIILDILNGMAFAHEQKIIHRDLHLGNILKIKNDFVICDFGLSKDLSIERSMKSSMTEKNNHLFVDPAAGTDFTKLDLKSDIYSIGKIIDYIFTLNTEHPNHMFKTVVERCMARDKSLRYDSVKDIIKDVDFVINSVNQEENRQHAVSNILNAKYNAQVHEYVMAMVDADKISKFLVEHRLSSFGNLILNFGIIYQTRILQSMSQTFVNATGYGGWSNYDIFANIAYHLCVTSKDVEVKQLARSILEECAGIRYSAKNLLERLPD